MKKLLLILSIIATVNYSCSKSDSNKQEQLQSFQSEMQKFNDSSAYYFDIGLKMLKNGSAPNKVSDSIKIKLLHFQSEIDKKAKNFQKTAEKLKLSKIEFDSVFSQLNKDFKTNLEKYKFLKDNGVEIN